MTTASLWPTWTVQLHNTFKAADVARLIADHFDELEPTDGWHPHSEVTGHESCVFLWYSSPGLERRVSHYSDLPLGVQVVFDPGSLHGRGICMAASVQLSVVELAGRAYQVGELFETRSDRSHAVTLFAAMQAVVEQNLPLNPRPKPTTSRRRVTSSA